jgi:hypothetical protein
VRYFENENLYLIIRRDSSAHHSAWGSTNCNGRGKALVEFINFSNLEFLNWSNEPTFCSGHRLEVIDFNLGSFELIESIRSWEVYSEHFL